MLLYSFDSYDSYNDCYEQIEMCIRGHFKKSEHITIIAKNSDWRGRTGYKYVDIKRKGFAGQIVPEYDCRFELHKEGNSLYAMVYHHDVPMGSRWVFRSGRISEKKVFSI